VREPTGYKFVIKGFTPLGEHRVTVFSETVTIASAKRLEPPSTNDNSLKVSVRGYCRNKRMERSWADTGNGQSGLRREKISSCAAERVKNNVDA